MTMIIRQHQLVVALVPDRYIHDREGIAQAVRVRLAITAECVNPWHQTADARKLELCPECPRDSWHQ